MHDRAATTARIPATTVTTVTTASRPIDAETMNRRSRHTP